MAGPVVGSDSDANDYKLQSQSKSAFELQSATRSDIESALTDLGVVTKTDVEVNVENRLNHESTRYCP